MREGHGRGCAQCAAISKAEDGTSSIYLEEKGNKLKVVVNRRRLVAHVDKLFRVARTGPRGRPEVQVYVGVRGLEQCTSDYLDIVLN